VNLLLLNWLDRENPQAGGAEQHLHETFGRLAAEGWGVTLVASGWRGAPLRRELDGIEVHRVGGRHTYAAGAPSYARDLLAKRGFDLVVEDLNKIPLFAPRWTTRPVLLLVHHLFGRTAFREASLPVAAATWLLERPIPRVYRGVPTVAVSASTRDDLVRRGLDPARIQVVENGVDTARFVPLGDGARFEEPTVLYLGRLKRYKRVDLLLDAVAALRERDRTPVRLLVAGEGDRRAALERRARRLGLGDEAVRFLGFVPEEEKLRLLQRSWVHVLVSEKEGWGITVLEAAACGTPSVASDAPGLRDSVLDGRTGLLVPHGRVGALADSIRRLLVDAGERGEMGRAARAFAEGLTWERAAARLGSALRDAVATPRGRR
jgi:glycosyltransferase involved in cell wall biosynthesis